MRGNVKGDFQIDTSLSTINQQKEMDINEIISLNIRYIRKFDGI